MVLSFSLLVQCFIENKKKKKKKREKEKIINLTF